MLAPPPEASQRPEHGPRMRILDLREYGTELPSWVIVVGSVANGGDRTTEELRITVNALGPEDRVVSSTAAVARSQLVPPGRRTEFAAAFERRPDVEAYHVKVLAW
jgi:hypothetical protein